MRFLLLTFAFLIISCKNQNNTITPAVKKDSVIVTKGKFEVTFNPLDKKTKSKYEKEISDFYNAKINKDNPSLGFLVAKNGEIIFEDYQGFSDYKNKTPVTKNTPLHLASVGKVLTATVILRMIDAKELTLETTFKSLFPQFPFENITIEMLLNHRTGLPNYAYFCERDNNWNKKTTLHNQDILDIIATRKIKLEFTPDKKFSYCNTNYALLALVIEKISNLPFPEAMQKLLFEPLKMKNSFVFEMEKQKDTISKSYKSTWQIVPYDYLDAVYGDKNIYSTPQDLLKFDLATYSNAFLSDEIKEKAYKGYSYEHKGIKNYGLGIRMREWEDGTKLLYHNGWWHGNTSSYITLKNDTVTMIGLSNKFSRKVYQTKRISAIFGDYPFKLDEAE